MLEDRLVRVEALDKHGSLLTGAQFRVFVNGVFTAKTENGRGFCTVQAPNTNEIIEVEATYRKISKRSKIALGVETFPIYFDEIEIKENSSDKTSISEILVFSIGVFFIICCVVLAIFISEPTTFQWRVFGGILSVGLAAFGLGLSGMIHTEISFERRLLISATGALAIFVLVYFFAPAQ